MLGRNGFCRMGQKGGGRTSDMTNGGGGVRFLPASSPSPQSENLTLQLHIVAKGYATALAGDIFFYA